MLLQALFVDVPNVFDCKDSPIIWIIRMFPAILFIQVNFGKDFNELLFCVRNIPQQLIVEMQDTGTVPVRCAPVIHIDMAVQLRRNGVKPLGYVAINGIPDKPLPGSTTD